MEIQEMKNKTLNIKNSSYRLANFYQQELVNLKAGQQKINKLI